MSEQASVLPKRVPLHCLNCGFDWRDRLTDASSCPHCASPSIWLTRMDVPLGRR